MFEETAETPVDTFEVPENITESINKTEIHDSDCGLSTLAPDTFEEPGIEEEHCQKHIYEDSPNEPICNEAGEAASLEKEVNDKTEKPGGHDCSHCTKSEGDHSCKSVSDGVKKWHGDLSSDEATECTTPESYTTKITGPFGHPSTAQDPTVVVCETGALAGFGCGLVVGLAAVHRSKTIDTDLSEHDSSPECPSNFDCTLSFDTDTDPDDEGCGKTPCRAIEKHGVEKAVYTTIHGITVIKLSTKDAGCTTKAFCLQANSTINSAFDKPIGNDFDINKEVKANAYNRTCPAFETKDTPEGCDCLSLETSYPVETSEGIAC